MEAVDEVDDVIQLGGLRVRCEFELDDAAQVDERVIETEPVGGGAVKGRGVGFEAREDVEQRTFE